MATIFFRISFFLYLVIISPVISTGEGYSQIQASDWSTPEDDQSASNMMVRRGTLMDFHEMISHESKVPVYCILALGIVLAILYFAVMGTESEGVLYLAMLVFLALCGCEVWQIIGYDGDITWVYSPSVVGWLWTIINFAITMGILLGQVAAFILFTHAANVFGNRDCNIFPGLICIPVGFVVWFISGLIRIGDGMTYAVYFVITTQACQLLYFIYANFRDGGSWGNLLFTIFFYIIGGLCIMLSLFVVLPALLLVWVTRFFLSDIQEFGNGTYSESQQSSHVHIRESANGDKWYIGKEGKTHFLYNSGGKIMHDLDGNLFDKDGFRR